MRRLIWLMLAVIATLAPLLNGQQATKAVDLAPVATTASPATTTCSFTFSSGSGDTFFKFCVTANGNVLQIETPAFYGQTFTSEGYGLCNENPVTGYFDYAWPQGDTGNWNAPTVVSSTATSVKIARTTADGIWTLTQTFTLDAKSPGAKIVMALKNNTAAPRVAYLVRYVDVTAANDFSDNISATTTSAFGWIQSIPFGNPVGNGLLLQNVGHAKFGYLQGFARTIPTGPNPCDFAGDSSALPLINTDGSMALAYVDTVGAKKTKTATMIYRGL